MTDSLLENHNPFEVGSFANIDDSNYPPTPLYQPDSDSDNEEFFDDSLSILFDNNPSSPFIDIGRQVIRYSDINNNIDMGDTGVNDDEQSELSSDSREKEGPRAQYGFNGKILNTTNTDSSFFISNQK